MAVTSVRARTASLISRRAPAAAATTSGSTSDVETAYDLHASSFVTNAWALT